MVELAAVNWEDVILVGTAMGIFGGGKVLFAKVTRNSASNDKFSQRRCDDRHEALNKLMDERHIELRDNVKKIFDRLDTLTEHLMKK